MNTQKLTPTYTQRNAMVARLNNAIEFAETAKPPRTLARCLRRAFKQINDDNHTINTIWFHDDHIYAAWIGSPDRLEGRPTIYLDASADESIYQALVGDNIEFIRQDVELPNQYVTQVCDTAMSTTRLKNNNKSLAKRFHAAIVQQSKRYGDGVVIAPMIFINRLKQYPQPANVQYMHFGNLRGLNAAKHCQWCFVIGRNQPPVHAVESTARALWPHKRLNLTGEYERRDQPGTGCAMALILAYQQIITQTLIVIVYYRCYASAKPNRQ